MSHHNERVRALNDRFRQTFEGGTVVLTAGVNDLPEYDRDAICNLVKAFTVFTSSNNPYKENDFGEFEYCSERYFWKIDYFADATMEVGSEDPSDPKQCYRVLTIMHASDY